MTAEELQKRLVRGLPRGLVIDVFDAVAARARQAHELIRDNTDLAGRSARALEGQARFRLMEKGFQDSCEQYGGLRLEGDLIPGTDLRVFQPFMRFEDGGQGLLLGLASIPVRSELPVKNKSRAAGVSLNYQLSPRLNFDGSKSQPKPSDIFVLLLVARDPARAGHVDEVAIGIIDAEYQAYIFYEPIETFLALYAAPTPQPEKSTEYVRLKKNKRAFKPPENPEGGDNAEGSAP